MSVIGDIYKNSVQPSERSMRNDKKYTRAKNQINQYYQTICKTLLKNELAILDNLISCYDKKVERRSKHFFKAGFKTGMAVAFEALKQEE